MEIDQNLSQLEDYLPLKVRAPASGFISEIIAYPGYTVNSNTILLKMIQNKRLKLVIDFSAEDVYKIEAGQKVKIVIGELEKSKILITKIVYKDPHINPKTQQFSATAFIDNINHEFISGMKVTAEIDIGTKKSILVPIKAIKYENNYYYVYLYDEQKKQVSIQEVEIGKVYDTHIEILSGIKAENFIVVKGEDFIMDKQFVEALIIENQNP